MNVGQIFETHLGWAARVAWVSRSLKQLDDWHEANPDTKAGAMPDAVKERLQTIYGEHYLDDINGRDGDGDRRTRATTCAPGVPMGTPVFDGAVEKDVFRHARAGGPRPVGSVGPVRRAHRRQVRSQGDGGHHLHAQAAPPCGRQDPRAFDRALQLSLPSSRWAARRSSAGRGSARWRCGRCRRTAPPTRCRRC